jgi:uncharacterized membrane protein
MLFAATVPPGYGHSYAAADYMEAWVAVTAPRNWRDEDPRRLIAEMENGGARTLDLSK